MNRLFALFRELKRRKVLRVVGVYLVVAWAVIEVADTIFPNLGMPRWTVALVIVLALLGIPIAAVLAWALEVTETGVRRTTAPLEPGAAPKRPMPRGARWGRVAAVIALVALAGWLAFASRSAADDDLDPQLVAVMPFHAAGADASLAYMREGLQDLLSASLVGRDGVPAAVPARTVSRLIRDRLGSLDEDPEPDVALELARSLRAGRVVQGVVVGTRELVTVQATVVDVRTGETLVRASERQPADSLHRIVDRIRAQLVAAQAGVSAERLASLTTTSLPALRAYLEGEQAFRRGRHDVAIAAFDRAIDLDSTFALAALGMARALGWSVNPLTRNGARAFRLAWQERGQLTENDRLFLNAAGGERYPEPSSSREIIERREAAVAQAPELPELRYLLGDAYFHEGKAVGMEDWLQRSRAEFERVIAMDSSYMEPLIHLRDIAMMLSDTAGERRWGDRIMRIDSTSMHALRVVRTRELSRADAAGGERMGLDTVPVEVLSYLAYGTWIIPDTIAGNELIERVRTAPTAGERHRAAANAFSIVALEGRPSVLSMLAEQIDDPAGDIRELELALWWLEDTAAARAAAAEVSARLASTAPAPDFGRAADPRLVRTCLLGHWRQLSGDRASVTRTVAELRRVATGGTGATVNLRTASTATLCAQVLEAATAVDARRGDARNRLLALDDSLADAPPVDPDYLSAANLVLSRLFDRVGDREHALGAARRQRVAPRWDLRMVGVLEVARLSDALGRREDAIAGYAEYVAWNARAEPPFRERAEEARRRLASLTSERR